MILNGNIRTFHNIGYTDYDDKELTQKEASDYRMLAYQIKMIEYILNDYELTDSIVDFFDVVNDYFNRIFDAFLKKDEKLAHKLWFENQSLELEGKKLMKGMSNEQYKIVF